MKNALLRNVVQAAKAKPVPAAAKAPTAARRCSAPAAEAPAY